MLIEDSEPPDEPHQTQCPVYVRLCYREACDSDLGCIEIRRAAADIDAAVHRVQEWLAQERDAARSRIDLTNHQIAQLLKAAYGDLTQ
jgi:hypothetical protein